MRVTGRLLFVEATQSRSTDIASTAALAIRAPPPPWASTTLSSSSLRNHPRPNVMPFRGAPFLMATSGRAINWTLSGVRIRTPLSSPPRSKAVAKRPRSFAKTEPSKERSLWKAVRAPRDRATAVPRRALRSARFAK